MRFAIAALLAASAASLAGCFGTEIPAQKAEENPLEGVNTTKPADDPGRGQDAPNARKASSYDKKLTQGIVNRAARTASECSKIHTEGPFGDVTVVVIISGKGKIADAQIPAPYDGTPIGKCIEKAFESEIIPPWDGPDERLDAQLSLKKPDDADKKKK